MQEERWRLAVAATGIGTWEVDGATGTHHWSPEFRSICGLPAHATADEAVFRSLIHPDDHDWVDALYQRAYDPTGAGSYNAEFRIVRANDGLERWVLARGRVWFDEGDDPVRGTGILLDVTEQRRTKEALEESEERYRLAVASFHGAVYETDLVNAHAYRAPQAYEMLGVAPSEGEPTREWWHRRIHPADQEGFREAVHEAMRLDGNPIDVEYRIRHESGEWIWVWHRGTTLFQDGEPRKLVGAFLDVTARKQAEDALLARRRELETVLDTVPAAVWFTYDPDARHVVQNRHAAVLTQGRRENFLNPDDLPDRLHLVKADRKLPRSDYPLERALRGEAVVDDEYDLAFPNGSRRTLLVNAARLFGENGKVGAVSVALDITERRRSEEERQLLVHELNHRVKNTLATVQSMAAQALRSSDGNAQAREALTSRLLALSRAHDLLTRESWDGAALSDIVQDVLSMHDRPDMSRIRAVGPRVRLEPQASLACAMALHELATNAIKHGALSDARGRVELEWDIHNVSSEEFRISVRWSEKDGPIVVPPTRKGFGSRLLERSFANIPGGQLELRFDPGGVTCSFDVPIGAKAGPMT
jgi:PAS domain S-box-containing protein